MCAPVYESRSISAARRSRVASLTDFLFVRRRSSQKQGLTHPPRTRTSVGGVVLEARRAAAKSWRRQKPRKRVVVPSTTAAALSACCDTIRGRYIVSVDEYHNANALFEESDFVLRSC